MDPCTISKAMAAVLTPVALAIVGALALKVAGIELDTATKEAIGVSALVAGVGVYIAPKNVEQRP